ncbi:MAG: OmpH family outer membrane protein [Candidatus Omnitrophota bacterium]|nr:OmpH family outer membrane protein [Candidatus Omnitrophota bacterium]
MRLSEIALIGIAVLFLIMTPVFAESQGKIGYIDLSRSFDEYQKTKDFDKELEKKGDMKQGEREKLVQDIRKMREELELLNKNAREKKEADIEAKIKSLQEFDQEAKTDLTKERDNMVKDILKEMSDVIKEYGQKNGYSIILNDRVLLYGDPGMELTNEIIKILNEGYKTASQVNK